MVRLAGLLVGTLSGMEWMFTGNHDDLPDQAEAWLRHDPVCNTVLLTVLDGMRHGLWNDGALLGWFGVGEAVDGAVVHTPPHPLVLGEIPLDSVSSLAEALTGRHLAGVRGVLD